MSYFRVGGLYNTNFSISTAATSERLGLRLFGWKRANQRTREPGVVIELWRGMVEREYFHYGITRPGECVRDLDRPATASNERSQAIHYKLMVKSIRRQLCMFERIGRYSSYKAASSAEAHKKERNWIQLMLIASCNCLVLLGYALLMTPKAPLRVQCIFVMRIASLLDHQKVTCWWFS